MKTPLVLSETDGPATVVLTLNRPEKRNALSVELLERLCSAISAGECTPGARVLILRGSGPAFCAGLDLAEAADPDRILHSGRLVGRALLALSSSRLVTIAAVHGAAVAGGAGLMTACDFAVAAEGTKIGYPEPRRGLVAGLVMTFLRRQLRERDARELLLTGEFIGAERALAIGLVNRVVPEARVMAGARELAASVLQGGPEAIAETKRLLADLWPRPLKADLNRALAQRPRARHSAEAEEGMAAFREKRTPNWQT